MTPLRKRYRHGVLGYAEEVTPLMEAYLRAFEDHLQAATDAARRESRERMDRLINIALAASGVVPEARPRFAFRSEP